MLCNICEKSYNGSLAYLRNHLPFLKPCDSYKSADTGDYFIKCEINIYLRMWNINKSYLSQYYIISEDLDMDNRI